MVNLKEKNTERVLRIINALNCKNPTELSNNLSSAGANIHVQNIYRWKSKGMLKTTEVIIDKLLDEIDRLKEEKVSD